LICCCLVACLRPVLCVLKIASFSGLSICDFPFGILKRKREKIQHCHFKYVEIWILNSKRSTRLRWQT
jgi:hypothetical protein